MKDFKLISEFKGYVHKRDKTNIEPGYLVDGSQNVLSTDGERIKVREGYTLDGAANAALTPIESSYEWSTRRALEIALRSYDDELEFRYGGVWYRLADGFTAVDFNFAEYWDTTEQQDALLLVNGDSNIRYWSGGITTFASATATTITKQGTTTWAEEGFLANGTRNVIIDGITYNYTGGESTTTLTGVTPDPTAGGHTAGDIVHQALRVTANTPASGFRNDLIETLNNQVWVGSLISREVYVSKVNDYTNYTFSSPRLVGEGALLTLDGTAVALVVQEESMYISAGKDQWYKSDFVLSSDNTKESIIIKRLKTTSQEAAQSQAMVGKIKNSVVYISNEPTLDTLGRIENIDDTQTKSLSDPIKTDFDNYDFTNAHIRYFKNNLYIALPAESLVLIYNIARAFWETPQILPVRRLAVIGGELYGHSSAVPETYKLFDGNTDNEAPITSRMVFSYLNYGKRANLKDFTEFYTEGYISSNTIATLVLRYEYQGSTSVKEYDINGDDETILFSNDLDGSLGKESLGKKPLGSIGEDIDEELPPKFRIIHTMPQEDFYEIQVEYKTDGEDQRFEVLAFGPAVETSSSDNNSIKK